MALNYTWLESKEFWLQVLVFVVAIAASFVAALLSPRLITGVFVMISVLVSLSVAFATYGVKNTDAEPVCFTIMLSLIFGTMGVRGVRGGMGVEGLLGGYGGVKGEVFVTVDLKRV